MKKNILLFTLLALPSINAADKKSPFCHYKNMGGVLPERMCEVREFLKALPPFDPRKKQNTITNALLFSGNAGTGKTMGAKQLAIEADILIIPINMNSFVKINDKNIAIAIDVLYKEAEQKVKDEKRPVILLFDDTELSDSHKEVMLILNSYIEHNYTNPYITTIVTMNKDITQLDPGFKDRVTLIQWPLPSFANRIEIIKLYKEQYGCLLAPEAIEQLAFHTAGFSCRNIEELFKNAKNIAVKKKSSFFGKDQLLKEITEKRIQLDATAVAVASPIEWEQPNQAMRALIIKEYLLKNNIDDNKLAAMLAHKADSFSGVIISYAMRRAQEIAAEKKASLIEKEHVQLAFKEQQAKIDKDRSNLGIFWLWLRGKRF